MHKKIQENDLQLEILSTNVHKEVVSNCGEPKVPGGCFSWEN